MDDTFFVVRDNTSNGDVALTWNYRRRDWCWDVDAYYLARDGFEYQSLKAANARAADLKRFTFGRGYTNRPLYDNIRVVTRAELFQALGVNDHSRGCG